VRQRMRFSGRDGNLHRAAHPPFASNRDDDGAKRGGHPACRLEGPQQLSQL